MGGGDLVFYSQKIAVIVYASIINFVVASYLSQKVEKYLLYKYDSKTTSVKNMAGLCANIAIVAVYAYLLRQISESIPLPRKTDFFDPAKVKEVKGSVLTAFTLFLFFGDEFKSFRDFLYEIF